MKRKKLPTLKFSRTQRILLIIASVLIVLRAFLPTVIKNYVNHLLTTHPDYVGHVEDVDLAIWRGAYSVEGIQIQKKDDGQLAAYFDAEELTVSVGWAELLHGVIASNIRVVRPVMAVAAELPPPKKVSETGTKKAEDFSLRNSQKTHPIQNQSFHGGRWHRALAKPKGEARHQFEGKPNCGGFAQPEQSR